ncbi:dihydropteroate synthase [Cochlodiniinecator piscidefendens]|uniref:dihydropteroate synthase n=1 Tax=Cochlodiniinecator piscidefendens TaxID=2715756 RepID=UPI00140A311C|nr:dihydropteroate synthase [Cochlodiniinecator piscidefendens]
MKEYFLPISMMGDARPASARSIAGGWCWFTHAERLTREGKAEVVEVSQIPADVLEKITAPRASIAGLDFDAPRLMGILNVTPDSFSDGGQFNAPQAARERIKVMIAEGAEIIDIGGESTRPGAEYVPVDEECARTVPVISAIREDIDVPISIDTRKAGVGRAALKAGASLINDVSAFTFEPELAAETKAANAPVCLMHAQGDPTTMQANPQYDDVLLDVFDFLEERIGYARSLGISAEQIIVDPGIGFGKTLDHNIALLKGISLFHGLGCPILLGVSRKKFIGTLGNAPLAEDRAPGSIAVAMASLTQGVQVLRVHDVAQTRQALSLWNASFFGMVN